MMASGAVDFNPRFQLTSGVGGLITAIVRRIGKTITVLVLVLSLGLHWALLQTVAWTGMVIEFSHEGSLVQAVAKTLSGQHPCCICRAIAEGKHSEKKSEVGTNLRLEMVQSQPFQVFHPEFISQVLPELTISFAQSLHSPLVPPPRAV